MTPWNLVRFTRGLDTSAARRAMTGMDAHMSWAQGDAQEQPAER